MKGSKLLLFMLLPFLAAAQGHREAAPLHALQRAVLSVMVNDNISPVVGSRIFAYTNLAFYCGLRGEAPAYLSRQPELPAADTLAQRRGERTAVYAFEAVAQSVLYSRAIFQDSLRQLRERYLPLAPEDASVDSACARQGRRIGQAVIALMKGDNFAATRTMPRYGNDVHPGDWQPTAPAYTPAVEPNWGKIKPLVVADFRAEGFHAMPLDTGRNSRLMREARQVYQLVRQPTLEQTEIAWFWDDNPFALSPRGHMLTSVKKVSPAGHWMAIAGQLAREQDLDLDASSELYTMLSAAVFDALIYCWRLKYTYRFPRPEHIINNSIDPFWQPMLQSPPFPEFPSGHAVISFTAATVLTSFFGARAFTDSTAAEWGVRARTFSSLYVAAEEAAQSRVYGGIHFPYAAEKGRELGMQIGQKIVSFYSKAHKPKQHAQNNRGTAGRAAAGVR